MKLNAKARLLVAIKADEDMAVDFLKAWGIDTLGLHGNHHGYIQFFVDGPKALKVLEKLEAEKVIRRDVPGAGSQNGPFMQYTYDMLNDKGRRMSYRGIQLLVSTKPGKRSTISLRGGPV